MIIVGWLLFLFGWLFVLGCAVGSFLNVCIYRLPRAKNLGWPSSRCGSCLQPIRSVDNVPLLSYWKLGGRCRACGAVFSMRYFWVELLTGVVFVLLYAAEVAWNLPGYGVWRGGGLWYLEAGMFPPHSWGLFLGHATLAALLLVAAACLLDGERLPPSLPVTGAVGGLAFALAYPWPEPLSPLEARAGSSGFVPWPVWTPVPETLPPGSVLLGLATGLAGLLVGSWLLRIVAALHRRILGCSPLGQDAPGLVLLAGGFLGWQPMMLALALALLLGRRFDLALVAGIVIAWQGWPWLGPLVRPLFDSAWAGPSVLGLGMALFVVGVARWRMTPGRTARLEP